MNTMSNDEKKAVDVQQYANKIMTEMGIAPTENKKIYSSVCKMADDLMTVKAECNRLESINRANKDMAKIAGNLQAVSGSRVDRYLTALRACSNPITQVEALVSMNTEVLVFIAEQTMKKPYLDILQDIDNKEKKK